MNLGSLVRQRRKALGLTQEELARRASLSLGVVHRLEAGTIRDPHYSTLEAMAGALGVDVAELLRDPVPLADALLTAGQTDVRGAGPSSRSEQDQGKAHDERRSLLSPWAEYARSMAVRIRHHTDDLNSPAFRDLYAALFLIEERNHDAAGIWRHFEEVMDQEPYGDEPLANLEDPLSAFEDLAEALTEARKRADRMGAGRTETDIDRAYRRRADAATKEREQQAAQVSARLGSSTA